MTLGATIECIHKQARPLTATQLKTTDTLPLSSLAHFDHDVTHDVEVGMIPMIKQAQDAVEKRGYKFNMYASPWSPPAWMKAPVGGLQSMLLSATPNGLLPSMQRVWANYFSKFIDAYSKHGINFWGVTVQNEPEAAVGWEACLWTPEYMASFVRDHLGPVLEKDHPEVKIIGFDHNKDHVDIWAQGLYADPEAAKYFYGIGVHWYGGLNTQKLDYTHNLDPTKVILGTEACNCGGVVYRDAAFADGELTKGDFLPAWWSRAESLALDILEDLRYWAVGWTDWNLVLSIDGGPNHLKNLCDANIIIDNEHQVGSSNLIMQASYYYMGHFSRYFLPGSKRIHLTNSVEAEGGSSLQPGDVKNGQALLFAPCDGNDAQKWRLNEDGQIIIRGTNEAESSDGYEKGGACIDVVHGGWVDGKLQVWACNDPPPFEKQPTTTDAWTVVSVPGGSQILHAASGKCITAVQTDGGAVGLDKGLTIVAGQLKACLVKGTPSQTFTLANYDAQGFPSNFPVKTLPTAPGGGELCLQPQIVRMPHFDAVAFQAPDGDVALVAMNTGDHAVEFTLVDKVTESGIRSLTIPPHAIHTYRWNPTMGSSAALLSLATKVESGTKFEGSGRKPSAYVTPSPLLWAVALVIGGERWRRSNWQPPASENDPAALCSNPAL